MQDVEKEAARALESHQAGAEHSVGLARWSLLSAPALASAEKG